MPLTLAQIKLDTLEGMVYAIEQTRGSDRNETRLLHRRGFCDVYRYPGIESAVLNRRAMVLAATARAPQFEVDPLWLKPLPNEWITGQNIGVSVDGNDHSWIIHRAGSLEAGEFYGVHSIATDSTGNLFTSAVRIRARGAVGGDPEGTC